MERFIQRIHREARQEFKERRETLTFYKKCLSWMRGRDKSLERIRSKAANELKKIGEKQEREYQRLFATAEEEQVQIEEFSFANILANHLIRSSPADFSSLKGYGDNLDLERAQLEKIGSVGRNLLGIRGLEAVQVSSHRGPPTDISQQTLIS
jgi:hypothetical protein